VTVSALEAAAFSTGLVSVWLAVRLRAATWPAGIASVACYAILFFEAKLYADAALQLLFIVLGFAGWHGWRRGAAASRLAVTYASRRERILAAAISLGATAALAMFLGVLTDSPAPGLDAAIFVLSLAALWAQARKKLETWLLWIGVDLISIPVYLARELPLTAALYALFLLLCMAGLRAWRAQLPCPA
jgi:nicotinamide mononucleotide transporter